MSEYVDKTASLTPREISNLDGIVLNPNSQEFGIAQQLADICRTIGLVDMHDVVNQYLDLISSASSEDTQLILDVTLENVDGMIRKLAAGSVVSFAFLTNDSFNVPWQRRYEPNGLFGPTWENGSLVFHRNQAPAVYANMFDTYIQQFIRVQEWKNQQILMIGTLLGPFGEE